MLEIYDKLPATVMHVAVVLYYLSRLYNFWHWHPNTSHLLFKTPFKFLLNWRILRDLFPPNFQPKKMIYEAVDVTRRPST